MSQTGASSGLLHVTVASGSATGGRRIDLVLPGTVPVAELLPDLVRGVGLLDPAMVHAGYRLLTHDGKVLDSARGLMLQGVEDGGLLTVAAGVDDPAPRVYDDVVEAMADVVEEDLVPWSPEAGRRAGLWGASFALILGALSLLAAGAESFAPIGAAIVAVLLVLGGSVLARVYDEPQAGVTVVWLASAYAAVSGWLLGTDTWQSQISAAGAGVLLTGMLGLAAITGSRPLIQPLLVVGSTYALAGTISDVADWSFPKLLCGVLSVVVLAGSVFPWIALGITSTRVAAVTNLHDITADPDPIARERVARDARLAHQTLTGATAAVGLLLVTAAPFAVMLGWAGIALVCAASMILMLRTRQYAAASTVRVGLTSGFAGLAVTAVSIAWLLPQHRSATAIGLTALGIVVLLATLLPAPASTRRARLGDVAETAGLVALLPLLVLALGVLGEVG